MNTEFWKHGVDNSVSRVKHPNSNHSSGNHRNNWRQKINCSDYPFCPPLPCTDQGQAKSTQKIQRCGDKGHKQCIFQWFHYQGILKNILKIFHTDPLRGRYRTKGCKTIIQWACQRIDTEAQKPDDPRQCKQKSIDIITTALCSILLLLLHNELLSENASVEFFDRCVCFGYSRLLHCAARSAIASSGVW